MMTFNTDCDSILDSHLSSSSNRNNLENVYAFCCRFELLNHGRYDCPMMTMMIMLSVVGLSC